MMNMCIHRWLLATALAAAVAGTAPAQATIVDPAGDFLPTYTGPHGGDLDVLSASAARSGTEFVTLTGTHAGAIGTTPGAAYVWGINRGSGFEPFPHNTPPTGAGIKFDAFAILRADGTGTLTDMISGRVTTLGASAITIAGSTISLRLDASMLPSEGFGFAGYRYNLWPRFAPEGVNPADNRQISDFAPGVTSFTASVPEPESWGLLTAGFAFVGLVTRRRQVAVAV